MAKIKTIGDVQKNAIINGNFDFWQRGTSSTTGSGSGSSSATLLADRFVWAVDPNGGTAAAYTQSRQSFTLGQTSVPGEPTYFWRINNTTQGSSLGTSSYHLIQQHMEDVRTFAGKKVTVSFYAKSTISSKTLVINFYQDFGTGGSPSSGVRVPAQTVTLTSSWQKFTLTFDIPSISGKTLGSNNNSKLHLSFFTQIGSAEATLYSTSAVTWQGTGDTDIAQVMLNEGETAQPFKMFGNDLSGELQACQRFFCKSYNVDVAPATAGAASPDLFHPDPNGALNNVCHANIEFPVRMRASPSITWYRPSTGAVNVGEGFQDSAVTATITAGNANQHGIAAVTFSGSRDRGMIVHWIANAEYV